MGRYLPYRMHPLSLGELIRTEIPTGEINTPLEPPGTYFEKLLKNGGFPEPFIKDDPAFLNRWKTLRQEQLFREDIRDLSGVREVGQIEILAEMLKHQAGHLVNCSKLANKINASPNSVKDWIDTLKSFYYCFEIRPWSRNIPRALIKQPKVYLWDWMNVEDRGMRLENIIASHLLKSVNCWTDLGMARYGLWFIRDKEKREVDFLISKYNRPWFLVEVRAKSKSGLSKNLIRFQRELGTRAAFQVTFDTAYVPANCFAQSEPVIVPAQSFFPQLV